MDYDDGLVNLQSRQYYGHVLNKLVSSAEAISKWDTRIAPTDTREMSGADTYLSNSV